MRIFGVLFCTLLGVAIFPIAMTASAQQKKTEVRADVLAQIEQELARLEKQGEKEKGPVYPRPCEEVAYMLLVGLTSQGQLVKEPTPEEIQQFGKNGIDKRVQIFSVAKDARVVIIFSAIQDRTGYWTSKTATLYRRQGEKWVERGSGSSAVDGVSLPD